jgi:hypothetical protein
MHDRYKHEAQAREQLTSGRSGFVVVLGFSQMDSKPAASSQARQ